MKTGPAGLCRFILVVFPACTLLLGCTESGIRTPIHQSPTSSVYLEWVPQESFRASHPTTLSPTVIRRTLRGVRVQDQKVGLSKLMSREQEPERILSDEDVELLLPHILDALSQATSEEHVVFEMIFPWDLGSRTTAGTLHVYRDLLFLTLTHYARKHGGPDIRYVENRQVSNPTGLAHRVVRFVPKEALRSHKSQLEPRSSPYQATLAINYPLLETLPEPQEKAVPPQGRRTGAAPASDSHGTADAPLKQKATDGSPESASEGTTLRSLEEQMNKQERELEQMKKDLRQLRRQRGGQEETH